MIKAKLITIALVVTASPLALALAHVALGTKAGGMSDGGSWMGF
jgi:hypothetical protein